MYKVGDLVKIKTNWISFTSLTKNGIGIIQNVEKYKVNIRWFDSGNTGMYANYELSRFCIVCPNNKISKILYF